MTEWRRQGVCWVAYERLAMGLGLGLLALGCLVWLPFAALLHALLPRRIGQRLGRSAIHGGFSFYVGVLESLCGCHFDLAELDQLRDQGPLLLAANHPSLLDAVLILSRLPDTVCVMKAALMRNPLFGAAARLACYIRNDSPLAMVVDADEALRRGSHLLIFIEGTRTGEFPLDPCLPTAGLISRRSRVAVQTLLIEFSIPYLGKHWPLSRRPTLPLYGRVRIGRRFSPSADVATTTREIEAYFRTELLSQATAMVVPAGLPHTHNAH